MSSKLFVVLTVLIAIVSADSDDEAPWTQCAESELQNPIASSDVQIFITNCNRNETRCNLVRGTNASITAVFTPTTGSDDLERAIIARFPRLLRGREVEIPYGGNVDACIDAQLVSNGTTCATTGLIQNQEYTYESTFPVFASAPKTELEVRFILRKPGRRLSRRTQRGYRNHPGPTFVCAVIPVALV